MRKASPVITEDAETLKPRLQREHDGRKNPRLHRRYRTKMSLIASG